ncbi:MAG: TRAFs-binding domain-containing protein [Acidobacteriota bacterium]
MAERPLCFVLMPFGSKDNPDGGGPIDFDAVYWKGIAPAVKAAGLEAIRADAEAAGGIIHKAMYERLLLCDYAVADLTTANANVFYELGVRHATRPHTTVTIFATSHKMPFDVNHLRSLPYELGKGNKFPPGQAKKLKESLTQRLLVLKKESAQGGALPDSPLFQLLDGYKAPDIARLKTDVFRQQVRYSQQARERLERARKSKKKAAQQLDEVQRGLGDLADTEAGILVDLFLSYRAIEDYQAMIDLYAKLPSEIRRSVLVREQLAFALNRAGEGDRALKLLEEVEEEQGPNSETCGLMGRVYKDRWQAATKAGQKLHARANLKKAIAAYIRGFEADWRDHYPGINAVTLLDIRATEEDLKKKGELLPVVRYSARQRLRGKPDYWDHATLLELAVLANDEDAAFENLSDALAAVREDWEAKTTANNLEMIYKARLKRGQKQAWVEEVMEELRAAMKRG